MPMIDKLVVIYSIKDAYASVGFPHKACAR